MFDRHIKPNQYLMMITIENVRQSYYFVYILTKHYQTDKTHVLEIQEHLLFPKNTPRDAACSQRACKFENHPSISTEISLSMYTLCFVRMCLHAGFFHTLFKGPQSPSPVKFWNELFADSTDSSESLSSSAPWSWARVTMVWAGLILILRSANACLPCVHIYIYYKFIYIYRPSVRSVRPSASDPSDPSVRPIRPSDRGPGSWAHGSHRIRNDEQVNFRISKQI
jgi:hypothetical protein